jgi:hypothetical protein
MRNTSAVVRPKAIAFWSVGTMLAWPPTTMGWSLPPPTLPRRVEIAFVIAVTLGPG